MLNHGLYLRFTKKTVCELVPSLGLEGEVDLVIERHLCLAHSERDVTSHSEPSFSNHVKSKCSQFLRYYSVEEVDGVIYVRSNRVNVPKTLCTSKPVC